MTRNPYKRRQYIVDPGFQYRFIRQVFFFAGLMLMMSLIFLTAVYYLYGDVQLALIQPDPYASADNIDTLAARRTLMDLLWPVMAACLAVTLAITLVFGTLMSHRMAGPIFRIRRILKEMAQGDFSGDVYLRKKDAFHSLAASVNELKGSLREHIRELRAACREIDAVQEPAARQGVRQLADLLDRFRI